ncbi:invasion-associated locus B family protein [Komagataeibacter swingsii]|uniref:Invasion-associated locus B family protein n=2 Tax=Komagataeibacter swingsii TaxID=215220 RepID=A0A2V4RZ64_9PROT|nr:invasion-associated locus B family protein [Komagataeibacter swingsii]
MMNRKIIAGSVISLVVLVMAGLEVGHHATASTANSKTEAPAGASVSTTDAHLLPGGATSINESYQDWRVICQQTNKQASCVMVQQLMEQKTHKMIMNMELSPDPRGVHGVILLPFGLELDKGVIIKADNTPLGQPVTFKTCLPSGCIAPLSFDASALNHLKSTKTLQIATVSVRGQNVIFPVSMNGFSNALGRINQINK